MSLLEWSESGSCTITAGSASSLCLRTMFSRLISHTQCHFFLSLTQQLLLTCFRDSFHQPQDTQVSTSFMQWRTPDRQS